MRFIQKQFDWTDLNAVKALARRMVDNHSQNADGLCVRISRDRHGKHSIAKSTVGAHPIRNTVCDIWWGGSMEYPRA